ncbi:methyltransferase domain-containing protein [Goodfellowiella coeruleoviolacea]|uniref:Protein-L-isoaspartate O-methyltransferase n=1 Tax=Goodfellowiella coeruleoviolacea TaxID=334858 RepID=A0AAE3GAS1_9PSEU|nr:methyltransferase domain-containing protein [Goodfellowiella coeruleoviolacea]MCP2164846.1 protein-L-isoaspartate(D-aspartate) O-methyltransferase [Goodfellowiella coeruleoviolacea]
MTLVAHLQAAGSVPAAWLPSLRGVDRADYVPAQAWADVADDDSVQCVPIDRDAAPEQWTEAVYSDRPIVTQYDDGATVWPAVGYLPTCSASQPSVVVGMLDALDVHEGHRVLEIGTGTGYNAALLAHRLGDNAVTSIEVDPVLADQARRRLVAAGHPVRVVTGDGAVGCPERAPYDRVIATASVRIGQVPYAWVEQTRPGGVILAPMRADLTTGPLVRFEVGGDGTAVGRPVPLRVGFMELRAQRRSSRWTRKRWDDPAADLTHTETPPWPVLLLDDPRWAVAVAVPQCRFTVWEKTDERPGVAWLVDTVSASWASIAPAPRGGQPDLGGRYEVRQHGPRRLWDEVEAAYRWWDARGRPPLAAWRFTVTPDAQPVDLG